MVSFADFVEKVKEEVQQERTSRLVVSLSVFILHESPFRTVTYYCDKNAVVALVQDLTPTLADDDLVEDIAEFLSHIANNIRGSDANGI